MMVKKSSITKVDYFLKGGPNIPDIKNSQENGEFKNQQLPISFNYNGIWIVSHQCSECNGIIEFYEIPQKNFQTINKLYTKHYSKAILDSITNLFPSTKVFKSSNSDYFFITNSDFEGNIVSDLFIPQKTFAYYSCLDCSSEYLCLYRQGHPIEPDRGNPEGRLGVIYIDKIVQFETPIGKRFLDLLNSHKKSV